MLNLAMPNRIDESEHVFICGSTGCGKTVLAEVFLAGYESVLKLDTKGEVFERRRKGESPWYGLVEGEDFDVVEHFDEIEKCEKGRIIYAPVWEENEQEFYEKVCAYVYDRGDMILWIDELMTVTENAMTYPRHLKALYTAGRSRRAVVWALTQRPSGIPAICIANSQHFFVFTLPQPQDRKKMVDVTGCPSLYEKPPKYVFWYYRDGMDEDQTTMATLVL